MPIARFFCSGLFPYTFQRPGIENRSFPVVIGVFTEIGTHTSTKQFFYSQCQIIRFMEEHLGMLEQASVLLLASVLNHYQELPFEAEYEDHMTTGHDINIFLILAHWSDKIPIVPPPKPIHLLPL